MPAFKDPTTKKWYAQIRYTDLNGEKRQHKKRGFALKREAEKYEEEFLAEKEKELEKLRIAQEEKRLNASTMTVDQLAELFLEDKNAFNKKISYKTRKSRIDNWILPSFTGMIVADITPDDLRKWQIKLKTTQKKDGGSYSPAYLKNLVMEFAEMLRFAVDNYELKKSPFDGVKKKDRVGKKVRSINFWTEEEFLKFINTFNDTDVYKTVFETLFYTGMRIGELLALTVDDIDFTKKSIRINKTYHLIDGQDDVTEPKTEKSKREILCDDALMDLLQKHVKRLYRPTKTTRVFAVPDTTVGRKLKEHADTAGVKRIRVHDLRHSHASLLVDLGFPILLISERLGHEDPSLTLRTYSHLYPTRQTEVVERLNARHQLREQNGNTSSAQCVQDTEKPLEMS